MPEFIDAHGIAIVYDVHPAKATRAASSSCATATASTPDGTARLIADLTAGGLTVTPTTTADMDARACGSTAMIRLELGELGPGGIPAALDALWQFTEIIRDENPDLPLVLFGPLVGIVPRADAPEPAS